MDPLLLSLGSAGLGHAVKFLFDRASAALDRRAAKQAAEEVEEADDAPARELAGSLKTLEVYRANNLPMNPEDSLLVDAVDRAHAALERVEGTAIDMVAAVRSIIAVDQEADKVTGTMTGAQVGETRPGTSTHVRQRIGTVDEGGTVIGYRSGEQL